MSDIKNKIKQLNVVCSATVFGQFSRVQCVKPYTFKIKSGKSFASLQSNCCPGFPNGPLETSAKLVVVWVVMFVPVCKWIPNYLLVCGNSFQSMFILFSLRCMCVYICICVCFTRAVCVSLTWNKRTQLHSWHTHLRHMWFPHVSAVSVCVCTWE